MMRIILQRLFNSMGNSNFGRALLKIAHVIRLDTFIFFFLVHVIEPVFPSARMKDEKAFFAANKAKIEEIQALLADDLSKRTFAACIAYRTRGALFPRGVIQPDSTKYYPLDILKPEEETFVDCGAFNGDSVRAFIQYANDSNKPYRHIYAFEPSGFNYQLLQQYVKGQKIDRITTYQMGVSDRNGEIRFNDQIGTSEIASIDSNGNTSIQVVTLDRVIDDKVTFIKMDIESAELPALRGAETLIRQDEPVLAICTYHTYNDFLEIPLLMHQLEPNAKLFVRHYSNNWMETICYAIPECRLAQ